MAKRNKVDYREYMQSMEVDDDLNQTFSSDVDYSEDAPLLEENEQNAIEEIDFDSYLNDSEDEEEPVNSVESLNLSMGEIEEEEEYTEEEIESLLSRINLADSDSNKLSFDELMPKKKKKTGIGVQRKEKKVHHLLVLRDLVVMHPSVCKLQHCKFDSAKAMGYKKRGWLDVPPSKHKLAMRILEEHVQTQHQHVDDTFMDLADVPGAWLTPS